jgi:TPR repeat protein
MRRLRSLLILGVLLCPLQTLASGTEARREYIAQNYGNAFKIAKPAAENGDSIAMLVLGRLYFEGRGVEQDYAATLKWWRASADLGNSKAQSNIGLLFNYGLGVPKDYEEAARWFELSATQGEASAYYHLGGLYTHGMGYETNYGKALEYLQKAEALYKEELIKDPGNSEALTKSLNRIARELVLLTEHLKILKALDELKKAKSESRQQAAPR